MFHFFACIQFCYLILKEAVYTLRDMLGERVYRWSRVNMVRHNSSFNFGSISSCRKEHQDFSMIDIMRFRGSRLMVSQAFFMSSSEVYPGRWDWKKLWKNEGPYEELKLFDRYGNFIVDVELLEARGLLFHGYTEFQMHGDTMLAAKMIGDLNEMKRLKGNAILSQSLNRHLKEVEPDVSAPSLLSN
ncbi:hypothetical protein BT96DRAFT_119996 [Gymnopus androsaceus JB14]|uniref:Uncharacterized protein n=1 Tax=Gymnopus androsaceus JB14 TaxID=1447944 RepID=A0A6A4HGD1_9AGAR|nr:hypothetical protein BT96DRAFT_119996 [Gymnopus androsaceus JB14]